MKKLVLGAVATLTASAMLLSACGGTASSNAPVNSTASSVSGAVSSAETPVSTVSGLDSSEALPVAGGFVVYDKVEGTSIGEDEKAVLEEADGRFGADYKNGRMEAVAFLASQVVSGTNYLFLVHYEIVTPTPTSGWLLEKVYQDLEGHARLVSAQEIDVTAVKATDDLPDPNLVGGWVYADATGGDLLPKEVGAAFHAATEEYTGVDLYPLAILASQVVAGTNYRILCLGSTVTQNPISALYVADLYVDLEGKGSLTEVKVVDVDAYFQEEETDPDDSSSTESEGSPLLGGWSVYDGIETAVITEEAKAVFDEAFGEREDMEVAALIATKSGDESGYVMLCKGKDLYGEDPSAPVWMIATVKKDASMIHKAGTQNLDWLQVETVDEEAGLTDRLDSSWVFANPSNAVTLPEKAWFAFNRANEEYDGVTLSPLALIGTQVVAGTNYRVICLGTTVTEEPRTGLYVADVYEDLEGNATFTDVREVRLGYYAQD